MKKNMRLALAFSGFLFVGTGAFAQDELMNKTQGNASENANKGFQFKTIVDLERTEVKDQGSSGTCWSYCTSSFVESEMKRMGKPFIDLSEIFTARMAYQGKAEKFVRLHGNTNFGQGGALQDVLTVIREYGAVPESAYSGLLYNNDRNRHSEMEAILKATLDVVIQNKDKKLSPAWKVAVKGILDAYLGVLPEEFEFEGKKYTPRTFADKVVGINPDDYVEITSFTHMPMHKPVVVDVPDNWTNAISYNVTVDELFSIVEHALTKGYSISWAADVSEKGFSYRNGLAILPAADMSKLSEKDQKAIFEGPVDEMKVTQQSRQEGYDDYSTQDDHGMHIVGLVKDQTGKKYLLVKNSWGATTDKQGYLHVSEAYFKAKTISFVVHKEGVPKEIRTKVGIK